jgi:5'/3'-nucleotidase SurE
VRILITNDDGIGSPGLIVLEQIAAEISNDVGVVAPEADCSDTFGAPTVCKPLKLNQLGSQRYSLAGTPADCVLVGIKHLLRPTSLVCSLQELTPEKISLMTSSTRVPLLPQFKRPCLRFRPSAFRS